MALIESELIVGADDVGHDVKFFGATSGKYLLWDESADTLRAADGTPITLGNGDDLQIYHDGSNSYIKDAGTGNLSVLTNSFRLLNAAASENMIQATEDGAVILYHNNVAKVTTVAGGVEITGELQADTLDIDGNADISGATNFGGDVTLTSAGSQQPLLTLKTTHTTKTASAELQFLKDAADTEDGENLGIITFYGEDEGNNNTKFGHIKCHIQESTNGQEGGSIKLAVATHDGEMINGLVINDGDAEDEIDVTIGSTATSMTTVAGNLTVNGTIVSVGGSNANLEMNAGSDIILEADNAGGGNASSIQYLDAAGGNKIMLAVNSDVVQLCNRAANGTVVIKANTSTAGGGGETLAATFTDTETTLAGNLVVSGDRIDFSNVPTSDPEIAGIVWNSSGDLKISAGS